MSKHGDRRMRIGAILLWIAALLFVAGSAWAILNLIFEFIHGAKMAGILILLWVTAFVLMLVGGHGFRGWR